jgi:hypothetical protein
MSNNLNQQGSNWNGGNFFTNFMQQIEERRQNLNRINNNFGNGVGLFNLNNQGSNVQIGRANLLRNVGGGDIVNPFEYLSPLQTPSFNSNFINRVQQGNHQILNQVNGDFDFIRPLERGFNINQQGFIPFAGQQVSPQIDNRINFFPTLFQTVEQERSSERIFDASPFMKQVIQPLPKNNEYVPFGQISTPKRAFYLFFQNAKKEVKWKTFFKYSEIKSVFNNTNKNILTSLTDLGLEEKEIIIKIGKREIRQNEKETNEELDLNWFTGEKKITIEKEEKIILPVTLSIFNKKLEKQSLTLYPEFKQFFK